MEYDFQKNKPKPPWYIADLYTDEEWDNLLLGIEMGCIMGDGVDFDPIFDPPKLRELRLRELKEYERDKNRKPAVSAEQAAKTRAEELAKRIAKRDPDTAQSMLKKDRESNEDY